MLLQALGLDRALTCFKVTVFNVFRGAQHGRCHYGASDGYCSAWQIEVCLGLCFTWCFLFLQRRVTRHGPRILVHSLVILVLTESTSR